jgi:exodeoxyribonuclease VIII
MAKIINNNMTNNEYHSKKDYLSKSALDIINISPAHFKAWLTGETKKPTSDMMFGSLVHSLVLNQNDYAIMPECDRRTTAGKAIYEQFLTESAGKEIICTAEQFKTAQQIKTAVFNHPKAAALLRQGITEHPIFTEMHGVNVRIKPDFVNTEFNCLVDLKTTKSVDLKTTKSADPIEFAKSVWNYRYHVQAAFYLDVYNAANNTSLTDFYFIAVDKEAPFNTEVYILDPEAIERGRAEYLKNIETYKYCQWSENWPGYTGGQAINIISLPNWAK